MDKAHIVFIAGVFILGLISKRIRDNFIESFKTTEGGFSARKLSGFYSFLMAGISTYQDKDIKIICLWVLSGILCLSIITASQALSFWLRKPEEPKSE